ncbi:hypothetical protein GMSM_17930 [Geomonas sp. Red276]
MKPSQDTYPLFEVNQVLTSTHLNEVFAYLDEQERLTRANLVGIGIVCGLEISLDQTAGAVKLSRGCGVTSQGYLIVEPDDVTLVSFKAYTLPADLPYPPFMNGTAQFDLWELFPTAEQGATLLKDSPESMQGKVVLLFLELKKESLRNCSLNDCDDRGSEVTATVRRLLINRSDLDKIISQANQLPNAGGAELADALTAELNLPDLKLPRFDVPNTAPVTAHQVLAAFLTVFTSSQMAHQTAAALSAAYQAFLPLLKGKYPSDPFAGFLNRFGFLDAVPATTIQVRFLPYYFDLFGDLLAAYCEFRGRGIELLCACSPPDGLFPRHLALGLLFPNEVAAPGIYRNVFIPSPAIGACETRRKDLLQLFDRLVEMIRAFTDQPPLPKQAINSRGFVPVRITPTRFGSLPLSEKAIPYYYLEDGTPPLYQLWNPARTRMNRANQNLGFRFDEYTPDPPDFVTNPLAYDLEPYNFLRIEGHLGLNYPRVVSFLLSLRSRLRLPIDIIALRASAFDENFPIDASPDDCHFQDLDTLYATLKAELICFFCREVQYFYDLPYGDDAITTPTKPKLPLLTSCAPNFLVQPRTFGRFFESWLAGQGGVIPDIDPAVIIGFLNGQGFSANTGGQNPADTILAYVIIFIQKLADQLPDDLLQFELASFQKRYQDLVTVTAAIERVREQAAGAVTGTVNILNWEEIDDRLEDIIFRCRLDAFIALVGEFQRRVTRVKEKQFLSFFLQQHPGIQHKGGVPVGGTFILVYHAAPTPATGATGTSGGMAGGRSGFLSGGGVARGSTVLRRAGSSTPLSDAIDRVSANQKLMSDPNLQFLLGTLTGKGPSFGTGPIHTVSPTDVIIEEAIAEIDDGTIIADFFLPYLVCSDCPPIQFVLPKVPPTFTLQADCTSANGQAQVTVKAAGGVEPYSVKVDAQGYQPLDGALTLNAGPHTITLRDAEGVEAVPQTITVPPQLALGEPSFDCVGTANEYVANFDISGGTPPYTASRGTVSGTSYASDVLPGDTDVQVTITDAAGCTAGATLRHSCQPTLSFSVQIGCTAQSMAGVKIVPDGGTAPYQLQIDNGQPTSLPDSIPLQVGSHTIVLRDAANNATPPQTVVIPPDLVLREASFACEGTASYRSTITIIGGTQPYLVNGNLIGGDTFVTDAIPSGNKATVTVIDSRKCTTAIDVQHSCEKPCDLPCEGQSRRCAYRMWIQAPDGSNYTSYRQDSPLKLTFNGKDIPLPDTSDLLQFTVDQLNGNYGNTVNEGIGRLNEVINAALVAALGDAGKNRLVITAPDPGVAFPFGVIMIEHFVCETFALEFNYSFAKPDPAYSLTVRYTNEAPTDGMILTNRRLRNKQTTVPAFLCAERNLCTNTPYHPLCSSDPPKGAIKIGKSGNNFVFTGSVVGGAAIPVTAWVWDVVPGGSNEPFYEGEKVTAGLAQASATVRLTIITKDGCFGRADAAIG